jgi:hypothetical protein
MEEDTEGAVFGARKVIGVDFWGTEKRRFARCWGLFE